MERGYDLLECLDAIDPAACSYYEWLHVGMAMHAEGLGCEAWDAWSRRDAARYHQGECAAKWRGFGRGASEVRGGTIVQMARDAGWEPRAAADRGAAIGWDVEELPADDGPIVDPTWVESRELAEPGDGWQGWRDLVRYLEALFEPGEVVGYVVESWRKKDGGRWLPNGKGPHSETAGEIIERVTKHGGDLAASIGWNNAEAGAWIRFNPLDGKGVRNANVAEFRYALVESDEMEVGRQLAIIEELELPVAALVHSGNKSLHAIVRIDAADYDEYRRRVDFLYATCAKNGLKLDTQNKNPSRLSRMPGVTRGGRKQWLVATGVGKGSWAEWREWVDEVNDDLPEPENLAGVWDDLPPLAPPLIDGVLRQGHKMLLAGPSKAGKSFALIELCVAIAEGVPWLGFGCARGRVLYVNLELDRASCLHRFKDVYSAMGAEPRHLRDIDVWNLRGKSKPMDQLAPSLIRRALKTRPIAVVIDPIYKVITGDENSADQMAAFCNQFDRVATEIGCAVVYCHHHSKGAQGGKRSMDRASGSGVFARDPDALLDMIELPQSDDLRRQREDAAVCAALERAMDRVGPDGWRDVVEPDDRVQAARFLEAARALLPSRAEEAAVLGEVSAARARSAHETAWRIEGTLREFPRFEPLNLWFDYPVHRSDASGVLADVEPEAAGNDWRGTGRDRRRKTAKEREDERKAGIESAFDACDTGEGVTVAEVAEFMGVSEKTARRRAAEHGGFWIKNGNIGRRTDGQKRDLSR